MVCMQAKAVHATILEYNRKEHETTLYARIHEGDNIQGFHF